MATTTMITRTTYGPLRGAIDRGVVVFRGIPHARPPVGPLRFAGPQRPDSWPGVRDASTFGPAAMQAVNPIYGHLVATTTSEDCLTLNVWTPAVIQVRRVRPAIGETDR
jgi:para-nitrobenzyl esterase